jgi:hypothetical protein
MGITYKSKFVDGWYQEGRAVGEAEGEARGEARGKRGVRQGRGPRIFSASSNPAAWSPPVESVS